LQAKGGAHVLNDASHNGANHFDSGFHDRIGGPHPKARRTL
jgi:hypothetical protein